MFEISHFPSSIESYLCGRSHAALAPIADQDVTSRRKNHGEYELKRRTARVHSSEHFKRAQTNIEYYSNCHSNPKLGRDLSRLRRSTREKAEVFFENFFKNRLCEPIESIKLSFNGNAVISCSAIILLDRIKYHC